MNKLNFQKLIKLCFLSIILCNSIFAQTEKDTLNKLDNLQKIKQDSLSLTISDAQKAYVAGNWKVAAEAYEQVCSKEPNDKRTECYLWNVLALSQTGVAKDFTKAGKRLDSLIQNTNPQNIIYADLLMTKSQFQLYLGKYDKASESLIHAIETAKENQYPVLKKVCFAIQAKTKNESLNESCKKLEQNKQNIQTNSNNKDSLKNNEPQTVVQIKKDSTKNKNDNKLTQNNTNIVKDIPKNNEIVNTSISNNQSKKYWYLQLGAFSVKENANLLVNNLKKRGIDSFIEEKKLETKTLYIVQSGNFESKEKATSFGVDKLTPINIEFRAFLKE